MDCDIAQDLISAFVDRQLDSDELTVLEAHLSNCEECRATLDALRVQDADLTRTFRPHREAARDVADRVIAILNHNASDTASPKRQASANWGSLLAATAAGFLFAVLLFPPWKSSTVTAKIPRVPPSVARIVVATGDVQVREEGAEEWQVISDLVDYRCPTGSVVRTGPDVRCEIETSDGSVIRLNHETEVTLKSSDSVEVRRGQLWCSAPKNSSLKVFASKDSASKLSSPVITTLVCPSSSSMTTSVGFDGGVQVTTADGEIELHTTQGTERLRRGETASIIGGEIVKSDRTIDALLVAPWVHSLLIRKGPEDNELAGRVDELLARIGRSKVMTLYEDEIRSLGQHAVLPLLRFVQSPLSQDDPSRRITAMRIVSDVAPSWAIPDLIGLLADRDDSIRFYAAQALQRLTGINHGRPLEQWRDEIADCEETIQKWQQWWTENDQRYPTRISPSKA